MSLKICILWGKSTHNDQWHSLTHMVCVYDHIHIFTFYLHNKCIQWVPCFSDNPLGFQFCLRIVSSTFLFLLVLLFCLPQNRGRGQRVGDLRKMVHWPGFANNQLYYLQQVTLCFYPIFSYKKLD